MRFDKVKKIHRIDHMDGAYEDHRAVTELFESITAGMTPEEVNAVRPHTDALHELIGKKQFRKLGELDAAATEEELRKILWRKS